MDSVKCPICKFKSAALLNQADYGEKKTYNCPRCGKYAITGTALSLLKQGAQTSLLSAWVRERAEHKLGIPEITSHNLKTILENLPRYSILQKQMLLLKSLERRTTYAGMDIDLNLYTDFPLVWALVPDEFSYLLKISKERDLVTIKNDFMDDWKVAIRPAGWELLEKQATQPLSLDQAFVAMSFNSALDEIWEKGIKQAIQDAGYKALRVDKDPHIDRIDAKIINDIRNSRFVVADVTEQKHGVYFEAGYALGIGRPVIWCVRQDDLERVHFDTRQYNHIVWSNASELHENLYNLICAVIGKIERS